MRLTYNYLLEYNETITIKNQVIKLNDNANCDTKFVIYAILCDCNKLYIGKSEKKLKERKNLHRHHIVSENEYKMPVSKHLEQCNYNVTIIYVEKSRKPLNLLLAEKYFISLLNPHLNIM